MEVINFSIPNIKTILYVLTILTMFSCIVKIVFYASSFTDDHLLVIGGYYYHYGDVGITVISDVESLIFDVNDDECNMPDLNEKVYRHASVTSSRGVITCGGILAKNRGKTSKCVIQYKGHTRSFPSMVGKRMNFGMLNVNETLFSIGGDGSFNTMESINLSYETGWRQEKMHFNVKQHCMVNIGSKIYVLGGWTGIVSEIV